MKVLGGNLFAELNGFISSRAQNSLCVAFLCVRIDSAFTVCVCFWAPVHMLGRQHIDRLDALVYAFLTYENNTHNLNINTVSRAGPGASGALGKLNPGVKDTKQTKNVVQGTKKVKNKNQENDLYHLYRNNNV